MELLGLYPKPLYLSEFSKTLREGSYSYYSFDKDLNPQDELDRLFDLLTAHAGEKHTPVYRLCDAEYMYCLGVRLPLHPIPVTTRITRTIRSWMVRLNLLNQRTWHGENYSAREKRKLKRKYLNDLRLIADDGFLAPHLLKSEGRFCEEYNEDIVRYFSKHKIAFHKDNYIPFYFVYVFLSLKKFKEVLFRGKKVLIITSFNERKQKKNFEFELSKEGVTKIDFYEISPDKSMLETIDTSKLPPCVDVVLIGAGIGSANIINQIRHLKAICIDAGHALDCFSQPELRKERICLFPND